VLEGQTTTQSLGKKHALPLSAYAWRWLSLSTCLPVRAARNSYPTVPPSLFLSAKSLAPSEPSRAAVTAGS